VVETKLTDVVHDVEERENRIPGEGAAVDREAEGAVYRGAEGVANRRAEGVANRRSEDAVDQGTVDQGAEGAVNRGTEGASSRWIAMVDLPLWSLHFILFRRI